MQMLFNDSTCGWLHSGSLGGVEFGQRDTTSPYLGVSLEPGQYHFELVPQDEILPSSRFMNGSQSIAIPNVNDLVNQKNNIQNQLN